MKTKVDLSKINSGSISGVYFADETFKVNDKAIGFMSYIFAGNGIYLLQKSVWGFSLNKLDENYVNIGLQKFDEECIVHCDIPKLPLALYTEIIESFKYVAKQSNNELMFNVYWDTQNRVHILDIVQQTISAVKIEYTVNSVYEDNDRYIKYLQIHSHHSMGASFSSTDNADEQNTTLCYYGVIGKINNNSTIYDVDKKFRIWGGNGFINIPIDFVIDMPVQQTYVPKHIDMLNKIINDSKQAKSAKVELTCGHDSIFSEKF